MCAAGVELGRSAGAERKERGASGLSWSARNTRSTRESCQLPASHISFMAMDQFPTVDFGRRSYPRMFARCLTHEGRNTVSGFYHTLIHDLSQGPMFLLGIILLLVTEQQTFLAGSAMNGTVN